MSRTSSATCATLLDYFRQFEPRTPGRSYVGGETHLYLGKQYRLKISSGDLDSVKLIRDLIRAPKECIDYVIIHELCHLKYHDHGSEYYRLLEGVLPDWEKRKHKLELALA
jgi:predicted metal-dependent hydrolase